MNRHEGYRNIESLSAESGLDSAGSLRIEMTRCGLCATASLHCPKTSHVRRSLAGPSGVGITVPCDRAHSVVVRAPYGLTASTGPPIVKMVPTSAICIHCIDIRSSSFLVAPPTRMKYSRAFTHFAQRTPGRSQSLRFDGSGGGDAELRVVAVQQP